MVREFFYVDVERARSMLAQIDRGVVEAVIQRRTSSFEAEAGGRILGIGGSGSAGRESAREESRSMQDITYVVFEELAEKEGILADLADAADSPVAWESGAIHEQLDESQIIRLTSDIQILDPDFFAARLQRVNDFADALVALTLAGEGAPQPKPGLQKAQRDKLLKEAQQKVWGDLDPNSISSVAKVISSLLAGSIAVRVLPCGREHPELSFGGVLLGRHGYIQEEREALFSRYGSYLRDWTIVMQIATVPRKAVERPDFAELELLTPNEEVKRATLEQAALDLMGLLEAIGVSEGPRWPSISVTPLAIYREVPARSSE